MLNFRFILDIFKLPCYITMPPVIQALITGGMAALN